MEKHKKLEENSKSLGNLLHRAPEFADVKKTVMNSLK
jgi:hypothetical protein